jgi:tight adherence protein C
MMPIVVGAGLGLVAAAGLSLIVVGSPPMRRARLEDRLAPYLRDTARPSRLLVDRRTVTPFPTLERLLGPIVLDLARRIDGIVGGSASVRRRLDQVGRELTLEQFRVEQVVWGAAGLCLGLLLALLSAAHGSRTNPIGFLVLAGVLTLAGVLIRDSLLTSAVSRRETRMISEFPTIAELLALAVGAGEGPVGALERVTRLASGELSRELARALADARAGASVVVALERMAARTSLPALARFVDGMAIAVERGTPLAEVLRAQATDVREEGRRSLLEAGGRKEIAMLVPVVFLVMPVTIVFALFPGFFSLRLAVP